MWKCPSHRRGQVDLARCSCPRPPHLSCDACDVKRAHQTTDSDDSVTAGTPDQVYNSVRILPVSVPPPRTHPGHCECELSPTQTAVRPRAYLIRLTIVFASHLPLPSLPPTQSCRTGRAKASTPLLSSLVWSDKIA